MSYLAPTPLTKELQPDETLIWSYTPTSSLDGRLLRGAFYIVTMLAMIAPWQMLIWRRQFTAIHLLLLIMSAVMLIFGIRLVLHVRAMQIHYGITDQRVLLTFDSGSSSEMRSYPYEQLTDITITGFSRPQQLIFNRDIFLRKLRRIGFPKFMENIANPDEIVTLIETQRANYLQQHGLAVRPLTINTRRQLYLGYR